MPPFGPSARLGPAQWPVCVGPSLRPSTKVFTYDELYTISVAIGCVLWSQKMCQNHFLAGAYNTPPHPLVGWGWDAPSVFPSAGHLWRNPHWQFSGYGSAFYTTVAIIGFVCVTLSVHITFFVTVILAFTLQSCQEKLGNICMFTSLTTSMMELADGENRMIFAVLV